MRGQGLGLEDETSIGAVPKLMAKSAKSKNLHSFFVPVNLDTKTASAKGLDMYEIFTSQPLPSLPPHNH